MKKGKFLGFILLFSFLVIAFLLRSAFFLFSSYVVIMLLLCGRLWGRASLDSIRIKRSCDKVNLKKGEHAKVKVEFQSDGSFPLSWLAAREWFPGFLPYKGKTKAALFIKPGNFLNLNYKVLFRFRGYYRIGPAILESGDLFGFIRRYKLDYTDSIYITVYPELHDLTPYVPVSKKPVGENITRSNLNEDPTRLIGIRDYQPQDGFKRIHWKATARTAQLKSKVFQPTLTEGAVLILDFHKKSYDQENGFLLSEKAVETTVSLAHLIASRNQKVGFLSNARDAAERMEREISKKYAKNIKRALLEASGLSRNTRLKPLEIIPSKGLETFHNIHALAARLELTDGITLWNMLASEYNRLSRNNVLIIITTKIPQESKLILHHIKRSGFRINIILTDAPSEEFKFKRFLTTDEIPVFRLMKGENLAEAAITGF